MNDYVNSDLKIETGEAGQWKGTLRTGPDYLFNYWPQKGFEPNWFRRVAMTMLFGFKWEKMK